MRHCFPSRGASLFSTYHANGIRKPYFSQYSGQYQADGFQKASCKKVYIKALQFVADHPGCKRTDIIRSVWHKDVTKMDPKHPSKKACRGYGSIMLAQLLYVDLIDYDKQFRYHVTADGIEVLKKAYINDLAKLCKAA